MDLARALDRTRRASAELMAPLQPPGRRGMEPSDDFSPLADGQMTPILVVDDNVDAADMLSEALSLMGYDVRTAYDADQALKLVEGFAPRLGILDIGLPGMDGYGLARALLARPDAGSLRLVALTGYGQAEDRRRSADAGFSAHHVKPASLDLLLATLRELRRDDH